MEAVLHMEAAHRDVEPPFSIGSTDYLSYGELPNEPGDDNTGYDAMHIQIGCPLSTIDTGSTNTHIPLVKSFEYMHDDSGWGGTVFLDTMYYLQDNTHLIPIRTKIQSGPSSGMRFTHIPSLEYVRELLTGHHEPLVPAYTNIIEGLLDHDAHFKKHRLHPLQEWMRDDLPHHISQVPATDIQFTKEGISNNISKFTQHIRDVPYNFSESHLHDVVKDLTILHHTIPSAFVSPKPIGGTLAGARLRHQRHGFDFASSGKLQIKSLPRMLYNPFSFRRVSDLIDRIPLTDFSVDVIIQADETIGFSLINSAVNRLAVFAAHDTGAYCADSLLQDLINETTMMEIMGLFHRNHHLLEDDALHAMQYLPIKVKIVKTMLDEAAVILYPGISDSDVEPYGGVYFDLALQALAPLSVVQKPIFY